MLSPAGTSDATNSAIPDALFSGLVRRSSEGKETVDYLSAVSAFGRCIAAGPDLPVLLHDACELSAMVVKADMLVVAQLTADGRELSLDLATFGEKRRVRIENPDPQSTAPDLSAAAYTLGTAETVQCDDITGERRFTDLLLRRHQMKSCVFVPLCSHNRAFGALGLVRKTPGRFSSDEVRFAHGVAHLLSAYLCQLEAEAKLRRREAVVKSTLDTNYVEKRSSPRREYSYLQRIAPILGDRVPSDDDFVHVGCYDISAGGFSFLLEAPPDYSELVILLGSPPCARRIIAKVVRVVKHEVDGTLMHLVGCQFIGRISD